MDKLTDIAYTSINRYFNTLSKLGYKSDNEVYRLILLLFIEEMLDSSFSLYIDEEDYRTINNVLYCLFGSTCLIPYPEFLQGNSIVHKLSIDSARLSEDELIRYSEDELIRLSND